MYRIGYANNAAENLGPRAACLDRLALHGDERSSAWDQRNPEPAREEDERDPENMKKNVGNIKKMSEIFIKN